LFALGACHAPAVIELLTMAAAALPRASFRVIRNSDRLYEDADRAARDLNNASWDAGIVYVSKPEDVARQQESDTPPLHPPAPPTDFGRLALSTCPNPRTWRRYAPTPPTE